jgi:hypothetical protein
MNCFERWEVLMNQLKSKRTDVEECSRRLQRGCVDDERIKNNTT